EGQERDGQGEGNQGQVEQGGLSAHLRERRPRDPDGRETEDQEPHTVAVRLSPGGCCRRRCRGPAHSSSVGSYSEELRIGFNVARFQPIVIEELHSVRGGRTSSETRPHSLWSHGCGAHSRTRQIDGFE